MTKFTSIQEWLATKPAKAEVTKVLNVINKGETSRMRHEMYEAEDHLRKLKRSFVYLQKVDCPVPEKIEKEIEETQKKIAELKKVVPVITVKRKKPIVPAPVVAEPKVEEPAVEAAEGE
jgi:hypothetical protein